MIIEQMAQAIRNLNLPGVKDIQTGQPYNVPGTISLFETNRITGDDIMDYPDSGWLDTIDCDLAFVTAQRSVGYQVMHQLQRQLRKIMTEICGVITLSLNPIIVINQNQQYVFVISFTITKEEK